MDVVAQPSGELNNGRHSRGRNDRAELHARLPGSQLQFSLRECGYVVPHYNIID